MIAAGIDLAARESNTTGICIIDGGIHCTSVKGDEEILELLLRSGARIVAIDAPLSEGEPFRDGERELIRRGFRPLPTNMESMQMLRERAERIKEVLEEEGVRIVETFPSAFRHPLLDVKVVRKALGIKNRHERDAFLCALAALALVEGAAERLGRRDPIYVVSKKYVEAWVRKLVKIPIE